MVAARRKPGLSSVAGFFFSLLDAGGFELLAGGFSLLAGGCDEVAPDGAGCSLAAATLWPAPSCCAAALAGRQAKAHGDSGKR